MGRYTDDLKELSYELYPDDEDFEKKLAEVASQFRTFDAALTGFLVEKGMIKESSSVDEIVSFITESCKAAGVEPPRHRKKWFSEHKPIGRKTAFELCFALGLDLNQSDDFFRRVVLDRGFDGHDMKEIVYRFAIRKGLSYSEAQDILAQLPEIKAENKISDGEIIYTEMIRSEVDEIESVEELIAYLTEAADSFGYNNATAIRYIRTFWDEIAREDGLAALEKRDHHTNYEEDTEKYGKSDDRMKIKTSKNDSLWEIYLQILGLGYIDTKKIGKDRSLKPILQDKDFIHSLAEESFPDRDGLNKILNGEHVSHERVRKTLILLAFYRYWAILLIKTGDYEVKGGELTRCEQTINNYLEDAGYLSLYIGNPYDWLILYSLANSEIPLMTFRGFMQELYTRTIEETE